MRTNYIANKFGIHLRRTHNVSMMHKAKTQIDIVALINILTFSRLIKMKSPKTLNEKLKNLLNTKVEKNEEV